jgi:hypothetical protein
LTLALEETGRPEEAIQAVQGFGPTGMLALAYVRAGRRSEAQKLIPQLKDPWDLAMAYTALGDTNRALNALSAAADRREFGVATVQTDPTFDPLRADPRFRQIVARYKIPEQTQSPAVIR